MIIDGNLTCILAICIFLQAQEEDAQTAASSNPTFNVGITWADDLLNGASNLTKGWKTPAFELPAGHLFESAEHAFSGACV